MKGCLLATTIWLATPVLTHAQSAAASMNGQPTLSLSNITVVDLNTTLGRDIFGPLLGNFPDPGIIKGLDGLWKVHATNSKGRNVPVATSLEFTTIWMLATIDAMPLLAPWINRTRSDVWAPDVIENDNGTFVLYYSARQANSGDPGKHCIGAATSISAIGPFMPQRTPLICDVENGGVIDASGYDDGTDRWLVWKVDGNSRPGGASTCQPGGQPLGTPWHPTPIKIQRMSRDGTTLLGNPTTILDNEGVFDNGIVEAPTLYKMPNGGDFVLFFSTHCFSGDGYDIQYAFSSTVNGTYHDRQTLLDSKSGLGIWGPGGLDLTLDGTNVVFHGRDRPGESPSAARHLYTASLVVDTSLTSS